MTGNTRATILEDLDHWAETLPDVPWLVDLKSGEADAISWREGASLVNRVARALTHTLGDGPRKVAILSKNRAHWVLADLAILKAGMVTVPVFTTMREDTFDYVVNFADVELLFLGESANWAQVKHRMPEGIPIVTLPGIDPAEGSVTWDAFLEAGAAGALPASVETDTPATIIFTSGTTGKPKGVMHSLASLNRAMDALVAETGSEEGWHFFSYLPLAHLAERAVVEFHAMKVGGTIYFNDTLESFGADLRMAKPDYFFGVPRIWDKLVQAVVAGTEGGAEALKGALTGPHAALASAAVRDKLGLSSVKTMLTTTAPTPPHVKDWFELFGLKLQDGYGQTEILPITTTPKDRDKRGSVGRPVPGVEVRITDEDELVARSPGVALGYYKMPDKTAETFRNGWVYTGDRAEMDADGFVTLKGRVKETFKTAKGKYVAPGPIEARFLESDLLDQVCLVGHGMPQPVLLAVLSEACAAMAEAEIEAGLMELLAMVNASEERHAQPGAVLVAPEPWTIENGILTHTMKIRRERVLDRFGGSIDEAAQAMGAGTATVVTFLTF